MKPTARCDLLHLGLHNKTRSYPGQHFSTALLVVKNSTWNFEALVRIQILTSSLKHVLTPVLEFVQLRETVPLIASSHVFALTCIWNCTASKNELWAQSGGWLEIQYKVWEFDTRHCGLRRPLPTKYVCFLYSFLSFYLSWTWKIPSWHVHDTKKYCLMHNALNNNLWCFFFTSDIIILAKDTFEWKRTLTM